MPDVIGVLQIHPAQFRAATSQYPGGVLDYSAVDLLYVVAAIVVGEALLVVFKTVEGVVELVASGLGKAVTKKACSVVFPSGKKRCRCAGSGVFKNAEDVPVGVIRGFNRVGVHIMFVRPGAGKEAVVTDGGDRWAFRSGADFTSYGRSGITFGRGNGI